MNGPVCSDNAATKPFIWVESSELNATRIAGPVDTVGGGSVAPENLLRDWPFSTTTMSCQDSVSSRLNVSIIRVPGGEVMAHVQFIRGL